MKEERIIEHCSKCGVQINLEREYYESNGSYTCVGCHEKYDKTCYCAKCRLVCDKPQMYNNKPYHAWCREVLMEGEQMVLGFPTEELSLKLNF